MVFTQVPRMFVTQSVAEQQMPKTLIEPGERYWRVVSLSHEAPWYLFVYEQEVEGLRLQQTDLIEWDTDLITVIESVPYQNRLAVARVSRSYNREKNPWMLHWIEALWTTQIEAGSGGNKVVAQFKDESVIRDLDMNRLPNAQIGRMIFGKNIEACSV